MKITAEKAMRRYIAMQTAHSFDHILVTLLNAAKAEGMEEAAKLCDVRATDNWGLTEAECEAQECAADIRAEAAKLLE